MRPSVLLLILLAACRAKTPAGAPDHLPLSLGREWVLCGESKSGFGTLSLREASLSFRCPQLIQSPSESALREVL